jgi:hypothetical protein
VYVQLPKLTGFASTSNVKCQLSIIVHISPATHTIISDMPRTTRAAKIKADANIASSSKSPAEDDDDDEDEAGSTPRDEDGEPQAKKLKGKGKGKAAGRTLLKRPEWEEIQKPPLHREWKDIPDWKGRTDSPLLALPVEVMDMMFCVRPDLGVSFPNTNVTGL